MTSPKDTSLKEKEGVDVDGVEWEERAAKSNCRDLNYALQRFTVA